MKYQKEIHKFKYLLLEDEIELVNFESLHLVCDPHYYLLQVLPGEASLNEYNAFCEAYDNSLEEAAPKQYELKTLDFLYRRASENLKETEEAFNSECDKTSPNINKIKRLSERTSNHAYYKSLIAATISSAHKRKN